METKDHSCHSEKIAAYIDGQLDTSANTHFEEHVETCQTCRAELNAQRQFMCELDSALAGAADLPIPKDFARIVSARATSDMRGLRKGGERRRALLFCLALGSASFALLGATAGKSVFLGGRLVANKILGVLNLFWTTLNDLLIGLTIISRVLSRVFLPESPVASLAALVLLALAVVSLSHLIVSYHRRNQMRLFE